VHVCEFCAVALSSTKIFFVVKVRLDRRINPTRPKVCDCSVVDSSSLTRFRATLK
jgi:hypothetical protein